ncbi:hypothetical protein LWC34_17520 [Kibdelosporangium philippinense]|uniref:40-residue YVTN family beta-propeller repeat-containing protein n=1 Tax=Kibdelosporangium philippinense TaxID=211113 RepID=A0ABS8Z9V8_9PSEU|nr:hypothetical protein [Kibdelosporangium philippinense]MCE7004610.1 hypothetical protein [Kibdelosporangium philippinense]
MNTFRTTAIAVVVALVTATPIAHAQAGNSLGLPSYADLITDDVHKLVFVTGGKTVNGVVVTDFSTRVKKTINNQFGASGLALSADSKTLYVALASGDGISAIDTGTLTETARYRTGAQTCPTHLARTENTIWFGYGCDDTWNGGIGKVDLTATPPTVSLDQHGNAMYQKAPLLTATTDSDGPVVAGQTELSPGNIRVYTVTAGTLESGAAGAVVGSDLADLALSPDGTTLYTASGSRDGIEAFNTTDLSRAGGYHTGSYPNSVAASTNGTHIATGVRSPRNDAYIYKNGAAAPARTLDLTDSGVLAPRGLAWGEATKRLFAVTRPANGSTPTLHVVTSPTV